MAALTTTDLEGLTLVARGKVRDIYATSVPTQLLFVATDRISAYDVILNNGIPGKGSILTQLSLYWFDKLRDIIPNHLITVAVDEMPEDVRKHREEVQGRSMLVRKAEVIPLEAIPSLQLLLYAIGSAWQEYKRSGTVHGITLSAGLVESSKLPEPLFTPSTKAEQGAHDENIHPDQARRLIGSDLYERISTVAVKLYTVAAAHCHANGVILADTKFEFGLLSDATHDKELILIDEVLTPDSSRYWPLDGYQAGRPQPSFDKQYLRDWLVAKGFKKGLEGGLNGEGWTIEEEVVKERVEWAKSLSSKRLKDVVPSNSPQILPMSSNPRTPIPEEWRISNG
ncbi:Bifunctional purine biosynthetic protein ade1 [Tulasnella sp. 331]|nr:Bifunctional purine biosynthetic protein ade1 [Tulasnella sp. 331]